MAGSKAAHGALASSDELHLYDAVRIQELLGGLNHTVTSISTNG